MIGEASSKGGDPFIEYGRKHPGASASFNAPGRGGEPASMRISGLIDSDTAEDFLEASLKALGTLSRGESINLDLKDVRFVSSTGVGTLTKLLAAAESLGVSLRICAVSPACEDVFSILGLLDYFGIEPSAGSGAAQGGGRYEGRDGEAGASPSGGLVL
ncbi:MAG TPA: STAS domain-containing protein, partial [Spirochaetales bacterium]|nr:STAS domain-containing protein [Spirochaetales bacterium]